MAKFNGTLMLVYLDGVAVAGTRNCTLNIDQEMPDATDKDSQGWAEHINGIRSWSVDYDGLFDPTNENGAEAIYDLIEARTRVNIRIKTAVAGDIFFHGLADAKSLKIEAPHENVATIAGSFVGQSILSKGVVSS